MQSFFFKTVRKLKSYVAETNDKIKGGIMKIIKLTNETQESNDVKHKIIECLERIDEREISSIQNSFIVNLLEKKSK